MDAGQEDQNVARRGGADGGGQSTGSRLDRRGGPAGRQE